MAKLRYSVWSLMIASALFSAILAVGKLFEWVDVFYWLVSMALSAAAGYVAGWIGQGGIESTNPRNTILALVFVMLNWVLWYGTCLGLFFVAEAHERQLTPMATWMVDADQIYFFDIMAVSITAFLVCATMSGNRKWIGIAGTVSFLAWFILLTLGFVAVSASLVDIRTYGLSPAAGSQAYALRLSKLATYNAGQHFAVQRPASGGFVYHFAVHPRKNPADRANQPGLSHRAISDHDNGVMAPRIVTGSGGRSDKKARRKSPKAGQATGLAHAEVCRRAEKRTRPEGSSNRVPRITLRPQERVAPRARRGPEGAFSVPGLAARSTSAGQCPRCIESLNWVNRCAAGRVKDGC